MDTVLFSGRLLFYSIPMAASGLVYAHIGVIM
jgi:hypothetical protein